MVVMAVEQLHFTSVNANNDDDHLYITRPTMMLNASRRTNGLLQGLNRGELGLDNPTKIHAPTTPSDIVVLSEGGIGPIDKDGRPPKCPSPLMSDKKRTGYGKAALENLEEKSSLARSAEEKRRIPDVTNSDNPSLSSTSKPPRTRSQSSPVSSSQRRTIFGAFWKKDDSTSVTSGDGDSDSQSAASTRSSVKTGPRGRSNSITIPESPGSLTGRNIYDGNSSDNINIAMFSPPTKHKSDILSRFEERFTDLDQLAADTQLCLPPLPSPLSRVCRNDGSLCSGGMYPLTSPRSILQKRSYLPNNNSDELDHSEQQAQQSPANGEFHKSPDGSSMIMSLPFSLTDSIHINTRRNANGSQAQKAGLLEAVDGESSTSASSSVSSGRRVQFDPRITITEYDDGCPRQWYSDRELEKFKKQTISLVQHYLLDNPELVAEYCTPTVDPVTGVVKKKTLYSIPILNSVSIDDDDDDEDGHKGARKTSPKASPKSTTFSSRKVASSLDYAQLANRHVRKILVVDPNKLILELFCKSLKQIFPHAELTAVQTGDEALHQIKQAFRTGLSSNPGGLPRGFDIVIIEERLNSLPLRGYGQPTNADPEHKKASSLSSPRTLLQAHQHSSMTRLSDYKEALNSAPEPCHHLKFVSGAEVIKKMQQVEEEFCRHDRCILEEEEFEDASNSVDQQQTCLRSLMIGVCVDQKHDTIKLWQSGADLVWGKPPPPMGINLRNQLVGLLARKRDLSSTQAKPCHLCN